MTNETYYVLKRLLCVKVEYDILVAYRLPTKHDNLVPSLARLANECFI